VGFRLFLAGFLAFLGAFAGSILLHELVHEAQDVILTGHGGAMTFNPLLRADVCGGKYACVSMPPGHATEFWLGEGLAVLVHTVAFPVLFGLLLHRTITSRIIWGRLTA